MIENMEDLLIFVFLFALTIGMVILSKGLPRIWLATKLLQVISYTLMVLTGFLLFARLFPVEMEETISKFMQMSTIETIFVVGVVIVNIVGITYILYAIDKEKKAQRNEEEGK